MQGRLQRGWPCAGGRREIALRPGPPANAGLASHRIVWRAKVMLDYAAPSTVEEAVRILAGAAGTAKVLAGGTDLLVQLRSGRARPALIAACATCVVAGPNGRREVAVESIATGPGRTSLSPGEFILAFHLPKRPPRSADAYLRFIPRTEMDIAVVGAAVSLTLDAGGVCADARVVLGAVAPTAILVPEAAAALVGRKLDEISLAGLDEAARRACKPIDDKRGTIEYRTKVAGVLARRAATIAYERAGNINEQASRIDGH